MSVRWGARSGESYVTWDKRFITVTDFTVRYDVAASGEWATLEINGAIGLVVERSFLNQYTILSSVEQDFSFLYSVDGAPPEPPIPVYRDFTLTYAVDSEIATIEVSRDFLVRWQSAGVVVRDFSASYQILADTASPGWSEEVVTGEDWSRLASSVKPWTPVTQTSTTWN